MLPATSPSCVGWACSYAVDDIPRLTVGTLEIDSSADYLVAPMSAANSIELLGGLDFGTGIMPTSDRLLTSMVVPLTLGAAQTWNLSGVRRHPDSTDARGGHRQAPPVDRGAVGRGDARGSGAGHRPAVDQRSRDGLARKSDDRAGQRHSGRAAAAHRAPEAWALANGASLMFTSPGAVSGPISVAPGSYSTLEVGHGVAPDGTVAVNGPVTLRAASTLELWIDQPAVQRHRPAAAEQRQLAAESPGDPRAQQRQPGPVTGLLGHAGVLREPGRRADLHADLSGEAGRHVLRVSPTGRSSRWAHAIRLPPGRPTPWSSVTTPPRGRRR